MTSAPDLPRQFGSSGGSGSRTWSSSVHRVRGQSFPDSKPMTWPGPPSVRARDPPAETGAPMTVPSRSVAATRWFAQRRRSTLLGGRVKRSWAGLYEMTPDYQPLIGPLQSGLWVAAGFSGHGFMMAPAVGRWLATWIVGGSPPNDFAVFAPNRFQTGALQPERNVV